MIAVDPRMVFLHRAHARLLLVEANEMSLAEAVRIAIKGECKMTTYDNTNTGALFRSAEKASERHPDYTGSLNVDGTEFKISAWLRTSKAGVPFLGLAVKRKDAAAETKPKPAHEDFVPF